MKLFPVVTKTDYIIIAVSFQKKFPFPFFKYSHKKFAFTCCIIPHSCPATNHIDVTDSPLNVSRMRISFSAKQIDIRQTI